MAKTLLMKTWLMVVVVALALVVVASIGPFAEDANALDCEDCNNPGKTYVGGDGGWNQGETWSNKAGYLVP